MHKGGLYLYPACASNNVNNRAMGTCKLNKVIHYISKVDFAQSQVVMCHPTSYIPRWGHNTGRDTDQED